MFEGDFVLDDKILLRFNIIRERKNSLQTAANSVNYKKILTAMSSYVKVWIICPLAILQNFRKRVQGIESSRSQGFNEFGEFNELITHKTHKTH